MITDFYKEIGIVTTATTHPRGFAGGDLFGRKRVTLCFYVIFVFFVVNQTGLLDRR